MRTVKIMNIHHDKRGSRTFKKTIRVWLVTSRLGTGKSLTFFFYIVTEVYCGYPMYNPDMTDGASGTHLVIDNDTKAVL